MVLLYKTTSSGGTALKFSASTRRTIKKINEGEMKMRKIGLLSMVFAAALFMSGCGQQLKQENEQLKGQVSTITEENNTLKNKVATLEKQVEDLNTQVANLTAERDAAKKELEAKAKPAAKSKKKK